MHRQAIIVRRVTRVGHDLATKPAPPLVDKYSLDLFPISFEISLVIFVF